MTAQILTPADTRDHVHDDIIQPLMKLTRLVSSYLILRYRQLPEDRDRLILFNNLFLETNPGVILQKPLTKEAKIQGLEGEKKLGTSKTFTIHRRYLKCIVTMAIFIIKLPFLPSK